MGASDGSEYDAAYMIRIAVEKTGSLDPRGIAKTVGTLNYQGGCGTYWFNEFGDSLSPVGAVQWDDKLNMKIVKGKKR